MITPLPVANALLVFTSVLLTMAIATGIAFYVVYSVIAVFLAGQLVGASTKAQTSRRRGT